MNYFIKEREWVEIFKILRSFKDIHTKDEQRLHQFIEALWYIARTSCQWRLLPFYYGHWRSAHRRFKKWSDKGIWEILFQKIRPLIWKLL